MTSRLCHFFMLYMTAFIAPSYAYETYDVVVYGGSSAGVVAAVQAANMGKTVVLIAPSGHLGGMTSNGLGLIDVKKPEAVGGLTRQYFYNAWLYYYQDTAGWKWEAPRPFKGQMNEYHPDEELMWVIEPHVAEVLFENMASQANVVVVKGERLNRESGVVKYSQNITQIAMESGRTFYGKMFIDATYEGDLMAAAQVSYIVGREPNSLYNEKNNGICPNNTHVRDTAQIDPYVVPGDPTSGLLPRIFADIGGTPGDGDKCIQAYCYRMCLTDVPENSVMVEKPEGYDESQYEILFRAIEVGRSVKTYFKLSMLPNRKTDSNNNGPISCDYIGMSWDYPEADYATREQIAKAHELWQRGMIWSLQNHPRSTQKVKSYYGSWGLPKDEFQSNNNWPYEIYVREARRMITDFVVTEHVVAKEIEVDDSIGMSSYDMDSHAIKYVINAQGFLGTEGGMYKQVSKPFSISYRSIVPFRNECANLLVPVCLAASHAAYGSIRMEPTFMVLGQSAATAACIAIDMNVAIQDVPYSVLQEQLLHDGQVLQ